LPNQWKKDGLHLAVQPIFHQIYGLFEDTTGMPDLGLINGSDLAIFPDRMNAELDML